MPSRRRPKSPASTVADAPRSDVERFAAALKESERADKAKREREQQVKLDAARRADEAAAHAKALATARRELERAVEGVRHAKQVGKGRAAADEAWKVAKAQVIELETGAAPSWAPKPSEPTEPEVSLEPADASDAEPADVAPSD
ncbi:MAG: hypothetical protein WCC60_23470 [Ilumatobacteraceae bacterium]